MNHLDKFIYKALIFLSNKTVDDVLKLKKNNPKKYHKFVPTQMEDMLHTLGYISFSKSNEYSRETAVTFKGIEQLRILEELWIKRKAIWISIIGLIISVFALIKSMGWV